MNTTEQAAMIDQSRQPHAAIRQPGQQPWPEAGSLSAPQPGHKPEGRLWLAALLLLAGLLLGGLWPAPAGADPVASTKQIIAAAPALPAAWSSNPQGRVGLISPVTTTGDSDRLQLGLVFDLKPGWKIYWRSPGDAGIPPSVDWKGSDNLSEALLSWPVPHRFSINGLETMGYKDLVVLPLTLRLVTPGKPVRLVAAVDYLVCDILCVPQHADLGLRLPAGPAHPTEDAHLLARFQARLPATAQGGQGISLVSSRATPGGLVRVEVTASPPLQAPDLFIERSDQLQFSAPKVTRLDGGRRVLFDVRPATPVKVDELDDKALTLTIVDGERGLEISSAVGPADTSGPSELLAMLSLAVLGGLILNLMPCVLPVLALKALSLLSLSGAAQRQARSSFVGTALGILLSFAGLAGILISLKTAGAAVGWGIQFQQPLFLTGMMLILTLFAANLFGLYDISLPALSLPGASRTGSATDSSSFFGPLLSGAFATLLATPCSAPFLGTATGFALARGPLEIAAIFLALGFGMAAPYLLLAASPGWVRWLPRPGRWMIRLRRILGGALLGSAGWLLPVLAAQSGRMIALTVTGGLLLILLLLALRQPRTGLVRLALAGLAGAGLLLLVGLAPPSLTAPGGTSTGKALDGVWQPFAPDRIPTLIAEGKVVLVDVTADWCITCQVNKAVVLGRPPVAERLKAGGIVAQQADWTRPDERISAYLASFGRYGIPFNVVYGPGAPDGLPLPELLSSDAVLQALDAAATPPKR